LKLSARGRDCCLDNVTATSLNLKPTGNLPEKEGDKKMARTTYLAPGVYVEEIPSAQQPIAGVGTNTVGFIGVVPDKIVYPVPHPDYDPVLAQLTLKVAELTAQGKRGI
jgi:hypothetical protein